MATKLKNMVLTSVDLVRAGANQAASIELFKSAEGEPLSKEAKSFDHVLEGQTEREKLWRYPDALTQAVLSIQEDPALDEEKKRAQLRESLDQFTGAMEALLGLETEAPATEDEEADPAPQIDTIVEVEKFNPFHDARGRFANKHGFSTYSANPKSKAGRMAISRSAQAGHGHTMNVHRESKGENIGQNYDWIETGKKPAGVGGSGGSGAKKPKTQTKPKPKTQPADQTADTKPKGDGHKMVEGVDLVAADPKKTAKMHIEEVLAAQGFDGKPKVISDINAFAAEAKANGNVGVRSFSGSNAQLDQYEADLKGGDFYVKCSGGNAMGRGMYMAIARDSVGTDYAVAFSDSSGYGPRHINMTLDKSAKTITFAELKKLRDNEPKGSPFRAATTWGTDDRASEDIGAYAAAKGYDAILQGDKTYDTYCVVLNRTKLTVFDQAGDLRDFSDEFASPIF